MAVSRALRRLLRVLELEENQRKNELEAAVGELRSLERALQAAGERKRRGRLLVVESFSSGEVADRIAGVEEARSAERLGSYLEDRIFDAEAVVDERREALVAKRIERRQTETLVEEAEAREAREAAHRSQNALDEWFLHQQRRTQEKSSHDSAEFKKS